MKSASEPVAEALLAAFIAASHEVLGAGWGCEYAEALPDAPPAVPASMPAPVADAALLGARKPGLGSWLRLSIDGAKYELRIAAVDGAVAALLPRLLGRPATADEQASLATELLGEIGNQVAGHLAGRLGEGGADVQLGTPQPMAPAGNAPGDFGGLPERASLLSGRWSCAGHSLWLGLLRVPEGS